MSGELNLAPLVLEAATVMVYGYAAVSAFAIGRNLSEKRYKRQAFGIGVVIILFALFSLGNIGVSPGPVSALIGVAVFYATFVGTYYWIDSTVLAARLTDPIVRDTFGWTKLRVLFWAYDIAAAILFLSALFYYATIGGGIQATGPPAWLLVVSVVGPVLIVVFSGAAVLPVVSRRSQDKVLRKHLQWFGVFVAVFFLFFLLTPQTVSLLSLVAYLVGGYFLYRSAKSLIPLYSFKNEMAANSQVRNEPAHTSL